MTASPTRLLLVDDDAMQRKLLAIRLRDAGFEVDTAAGGFEALQKVQEQRPDAIVSDVLMGDLDGFGLCRRLRRDAALDDVPIILLSAHYRDQPDQALARSVGASALLSRTPDFEVELAVLRRCLRGEQPAMLDDGNPSYAAHLGNNAQDMWRLLGRVRSAEDQFRTLLDHANDPISIVSADGIIVEVNERWRQLTGFDPRAMIGTHIRDYAPAATADESVAIFKEATASATGRTVPAPIVCADGRTIYIEFSISRVEIDGQMMFLCIGRDLTEQVVAARELATAEERYRSLVERLPEVIWTATRDGRITFVTENVVHVLGLTAAQMMSTELVARSVRFHPDDRLRVLEATRALFEHGTRFDLEYQVQHVDGRWLWIRNRSTARYERDGIQYAEGMISDITERRLLEESLCQSQKMEAMGQLTGGIAHDFNNILSVIMANSELLADDLGEHDPRREEAVEINTAAERAASLTRQLLAFSRRQVLEPRVVDLNVALSGIEKMLRRMIGEDIEFTMRRAHDLDRVRVDVGQIEQVIVNLVVNARDAMPVGGRLAVETSNVELDAATAAQLSCEPGAHVLLSVTDSGTGMDAATRARIFEPFFTTKPVGKGTGLGLSTCYGIVRQSGGGLAVESEVGSGTVFRVYLPRVEAMADGVRPPAPVAGGGNETILVVEDDVTVRNVVRRMLARQGYKLLVATNSTEALDLAGNHGGPIHLVLSDVIMPGLGGPEMLERLRALRGPLRALFMSGYTDHALLRDGDLAQHAHFLQKPFASDQMLRKIREALDA